MAWFYKRVYSPRLSGGPSILDLWSLDRQGPTVCVKCQIYLTAILVLEALVKYRNGTTLLGRHTMLVNFIPAYIRILKSSTHTQSGVSFDESGVSKLVGSCDSLSSSRGFT